MRYRTTRLGLNCTVTVPHNIGLYMVERVGPPVYDTPAVEMSLAVITHKLMIQTAYLRIRQEQGGKSPPGDVWVFMQ